MVRANLVAHVDRALIEEARLLASTVEQEGRSLDLEFREFDMREFGLGRSAFLQVWREDRPVFRSPSLGKAGLTLFNGPLDQPHTRWVPLPGGGEARAVGLRFLPRIDDEDPPGGALQPVVLVVARDAAPTRQALNALRDALGVIALAMVLITVVVLWVIVTRSLRPLEAVSEEIAGIDGEELSRRVSSDAVPTELQGVVGRVNELLARLESAFVRERAFSNEVAHELRTPLAGLRAILEVTLQRPREASGYQEALRDGLHVADQLERMVEKLLRLARLESGSHTASAERVVLDELLPETWAPCASLAQERGLQVEWTLAPSLEVETDPDLLSLVVRNLLENAVAYADEGGNITVETGQVDGDVFVRVGNTGSALSQEQAEQATQRFWRGDAARSQAAQHCGLGLALVDRALRVLGGSLELRSAAGGEFRATVRLAAVAEP